MINSFEILETIKMIEEEKLDIRTITMGISLRDCSHSNAVLGTSCLRMPVRNAWNWWQSSPEINIRFAVSAALFFLDVVLLLFAFAGLRRSSLKVPESSWTSRRSYRACLVSEFRIPKSLRKEKSGFAFRLSSDGVALPGGNSSSCSSMQASGGGANWGFLLKYSSKYILP